AVVFVPAKVTQEVMSGYREGHRKNEVLPRLLADLGRSVKAPVTGQSPVLLVNREAIKDLSNRRWELVAKSKGVDQLQVLLDAVQRTEARTEIRTLSNSNCSVWAGLSYSRTDMISVFDQFLENPEPAEQTEDVRLVRVRDLWKAGAT